MIRVLICDDHLIVRQGIKQILADAPDIALAGEAGLQVKMITGDYPTTAIAIARQAGIDVGAGVLTGDAVDALDDAALGEVLSRTHVFARFRPEQKLRLVEALKAGAFYSTQGPEIHGISVQGDEIAVECSAARDIMVVGRASAGIAVHGSAMRSARLPVEKFRAGGHFRVVVTDEAGRRAWSNPVWLDAIGEARP